MPSNDPTLDFFNNGGDSSQQAAAKQGSADPTLDFFSSGGASIKNDAVEQKKNQSIMPKTPVPDGHWYDSPAAWVGKQLTASRTGTALLGEAKGAFDTVVDGPAQLLTHAVNKVYPSNWPGADWFQKQQGVIDQGVKDRAKNFSDITQDNPTSAAIGQGAGTIVGSMMLPGPKAPGAGNLINNLIYAAKSGGIAGASQPVEDSDNFWAQKAKQTAMGAAGGIVGVPVAAALKGGGRAIGAGYDAIKGALASGAEVAPEIAAQIPNATPQLQSTIAEAVKNGEIIDPAALGRQVKADSLPIPISLTKGQAMQDPVQISIEQNMRGKNTDLAYHFNDQNDKLVNNLGEISKNVAPEVSVPDNFTAGSDLVKSLQAQRDAAKQNISDLYGQLRDANGGNLPLDGQTFATNANQALGQNMNGAFLPPSLQSILSDLQTGKSPMTYENFENLRTILGNSSATASRSGDGNAVGAINTVYKTLLNTPMTAQTAEIKPLADAARNAAAQEFGKIDSVPAYKAVVNDTASASPDKFVQTHIINANTGDVANLAAALKDDPMGLQTIKAAVINHLQDKSVNQAGKFSQNGYNNALDALTQGGDQSKAALIFAPDELQTLKNLGDTATHIQVQPAGSFVNNSNTDVANAARTAGNVVASGVDAITHSPIGSMANNAISNAVQKKASADVLNDIMKPGAGISAPSKETPLIQQTLPAAAGALSGSAAASQPIDKSDSPDDNP